MDTWFTVSASSTTGIIWFPIEINLMVEICGYQKSILTDDAIILFRNHK